MSHVTGAYGYTAMPPPQPPPSRTSYVLSEVPTVRQNSPSGKSRENVVQLGVLHILLVILVIMRVSPTMYPAFPKMT